MNKASGSGAHERTVRHMCNCEYWTRFPTEDNGVRYPMSEHAPGCGAYKPEQFTLLERDGMRCVMDSREAEAMLADSDEQYTVSTVMLTRDQFERLPDFEGF